LGFLSVTADSENKFGLRENALDLMDLSYIVESHGGHSSLVGSFDVGLLLSRIGEDDSGRRDSQFHHFPYLNFGGTVESSSKSGQSSKDLWTVVALDGVVGTNARESRDPFFMFLKNVSQITDKKGFLRSLEMNEIRGKCLDVR